MQAGLGGGSSNAATTLFGLNQLLKTNLSNDILISWSKELGADVPFFFSRGTALCLGIGEILYNTYIPSFSCIIAKPEYGLETPKVFKAFDYSSLKKHNPYHILNSFFQQEPVYLNDLENGAFLVKPELFSLKKQLLSVGFEHVIMTGSGTSFFCMGTADTKTVEGVSLYPINSIQRKGSSWYSS